MHSKELREHVAGMKYKSHTVLEMKDLIKMSAVEAEEKQKQEKKQSVDKVGNYSKYVKEMYWPKISEQKRQELLLEEVKYSSPNRHHLLRRSASIS